MTKLLPVIACVLLLAGCAFYPGPGGGVYVGPAVGYATPPPPPPVDYGAQPQVVYSQPVYEQGYGYVLVDPIPRFCCVNWRVWHYRGGDGRWHRGWRR